MSIVLGGLGHTFFESGSETESFGKSRQTTLFHELHHGRLTVSLNDMPPCGNYEDFRKHLFSLTKAIFSIIWDLLPRVEESLPNESERNVSRASTKYGTFLVGKQL